MKPSEFAKRMQWARNLREPACLFCTGGFNPHEPAIVIYSESVGRDVYFHAACYDMVIDQYRKAHGLMVQIILGHADWVMGISELDLKYPFRGFAPSKLTMRGE